MLSARLSHLHQKQTEVLSETKSCRGVENRTGAGDCMSLMSLRKTKAFTPRWRRINSQKSVESKMMAKLGMYAHSDGQPEPGSRASVSVIFSRDPITPPSHESSLKNCNPPSPNGVTYVMTLHRCFGNFLISERAYQGRSPPVMWSFGLFSSEGEYDVASSFML